MCAAVFPRLLFPPTITHVHNIYLYTLVSGNYRSSRNKTTCDTVCAPVLYVWCWNLWQSQAVVYTDKSSSVLCAGVASERVYVMAATAATWVEHVPVRDAVVARWRRGGRARERRGESSRWPSSPTGPRVGAAAAAAKVRQEEPNLFDGSAKGRRGCVDVLYTLFWCVYTRALLSRSKLPASCARSRFFFWGIYLLRRQAQASGSLWSLNIHTYSYTYTRAVIRVRGRRARILTQIVYTRPVQGCFCFGAGVSSGCGSRACIERERERERERESSRL